jgi:tetratricopeptide (TPR) repeat protein
MIAERRKRPDEAAQLYAKIPEQFPTHSLAAERLGHMARRRGDLEGALKHYAVLVEKRPSVGAWTMVAGTQLDLDRYKEAEESLDKAAKLTKGSLDLHDLYGRLYMETDRPRDAMKHYDAILAVVPNDTSARFLKANCLIELKRIPDAMVELNRVLEKDPYNALALKAVIRLIEDDPSKADRVKEYRARLARLAKYPPKVRTVSDGK